MLIRFIATIVLVATFPYAAIAQSGSRGSASASRSQSVSPPQFNAPQITAPQITAPQISAPQSSVPGDLQSSPIGEPVYGNADGSSISTPGPVINSDPTTVVMQPQPSANPTSASSADAGSTNDPIWDINDPSSSVFVDHSYLDCFLARYVSTDKWGLNRVNYRGVTARDCTGLRNYLNYLQSTDVRTLNRNEQLAYWLNLYNARTIKLILDHYPLNSIRKIKSNPLDLLGPFDDQLICVLGKSLSLNDVESGIIRPIWGDPRIHYALNCASYGCPNLQCRAWSSVDLDGQLNAAAYQFVNSDRAVRTGPLGGVRVSKIYKWYAEDFGDSDQAVLQHIRGYANAATCRKLGTTSTISGHFYDWSLIDTRKAKSPLLERLVR